MEAPDLLVCRCPRLTLAHQTPFKMQEPSAGLNSTLKKGPAGAYFAGTTATGPLARTVPSHTLRWHQNAI